MEITEEPLKAAIAVSEMSIDETLRSKLENMRVAERVPVMWGIRRAFDDNFKLKYSGRYKYICHEVLYIDKQKNGKYTFCSNFLYQGHELIRKCAEKLGYCKISRLFGFRIELTLEQVWNVIKEIPFYKSLYEGETKTFKKCLFSKEKAKECTNEFNRPLLEENSRIHIEELKIDNIETQNIDEYILKEYVKSHIDEIKNEFPELFIKSECGKRKKLLRNKRI